MPTVGSYLRARSVRDGLIRGRKIWTAVGVFVWGLRLLRKMGERRPVTVAREVLSPGESITVTSIARESAES